MLTLLMSCYIFYILHNYVGRYDLHVMGRLLSGWPHWFMLLSFLSLSLPTFFSWEPEMCFHWIVGCDCELLILLCAWDHHHHMTLGEWVEFTGGKRIPFAALKAGYLNICPSHASWLNMSPCSRFVSPNSAIQVFISIPYVLLMTFRPLFHCLPHFCYSILLIYSLLYCCAPFLFHSDIIATSLPHAIYLFVLAPLYVFWCSRCFLSCRLPVL